MQTESIPLPVDPTQTHPVYIDSDMDIPEAERPTFIARYLNRRQERELTELLSVATDSKATNEAAEAAIDAALAIQIVDWKNVRYPHNSQPIPFLGADGKPQFDEGLDLVRKYELILETREKLRTLHYEAKKNWRLRSRSATAPSAANAAPSESATNPPANPTE